MEKARETMEEIEELKRNELMIRDNSMLYRQTLVNDSTGALCYIQIFMIHIVAYERVLYVHLDYF